jgi:hypothetical protein
MNEQQFVRMSCWKQVSRALDNPDYYNHDYSNLDYGNRNFLVAQIAPMR